MTDINYIFDKGFKISEEQYEIFKAFFNQSQNTSEKECSNAYLTRCLATIIGAHGQHWRIIGITKEALDYLKNNDFTKPKFFLQRGHLIPRVNSVALIFRNRKDFVSKSEFEKIYSVYDLTILMTKDQNKYSDTIPDFYLFPEDKMTLFKNRFIGFDYGKKEIEFLKQLSIKANKPLYKLEDIYPYGLETHESV